MTASSMPEGATGSTDWRPVVTSRQVLTTRVNRVAGTELARALHKDESTVSRILSGERGCTFDDFCTILDLTNLKLVDKGKHCIPADELRMLRRVYNLVTARDLVFEDPE